MWQVANGKWQVACSIASSLARLGEEAGQRERQLPLRLAPHLSVVTNHKPAEASSNALVDSAALEAARSSTRGGGWALSVPASAWECRAAQSREARPEEAQEPSCGTAKGAL